MEPAASAHALMVTTEPTESAHHVALPVPSVQDPSSHNVQLVLVVTYSQHPLVSTHVQKESTRTELTVSAVIPTVLLVPDLNNVENAQTH